MAYASLFSKDISPFNPERFKHEIQSPLTLDDVRNFVGDFVKRNGRNFTQSKDETWEFLLPKCLRDIPGLEKRYSRATFARKDAIRHSELEFMAMGHPFTDAAIQHCGTVEFGGYAASRKIMSSELAGTKGIHFNFVVKVTRATADGETVSFELEPVFIDEKWTFQPGCVSE